VEGTARLAVELAQNPGGSRVRGWSRKVGGFKTSGIGRLVVVGSGDGVTGGVVLSCNVSRGGEAVRDDGDMMRTGVGSGCVGELCVAGVGDGGVGDNGGGVYVVETVLWVSVVVVGGSGCVADWGIVFLGTEGDVGVCGSLEGSTERSRGKVGGGDEGVMVCMAVWGERSGSWMGALETEMGEMSVSVLYSSVMES